jgi:hypothetical protein
MTPARALQASTSVAPTACGLGHRKGRLAASYDADILAIHGNPLEDPASLHRIRAVFVRGTAWHQPIALSAVWALVHGLAFLCLDGKLDTATPEALTGRVRATIHTLLLLTSQIEEVDRRSPTG